jgi:hypothetical protein
VLLENAKEDGVWITPRDNEWSLSEKSHDPTRVFDMTETLEQLDQKAGDAGLNTEITLYTTRIRIKK